MRTIIMIAAAVAALGGSAVAQEYPSRTIEVVTHAGNGGGTDVTARMMMLRARRELGQDMVIVNKGGGGGASALEYYQTLDSDGYAILTYTVGHAAVMAKGQGGMELEDLRPIARATDDPQILMTKCGVYANAEDFIAQQKEAPITYGVTHLGNIDDVSAFMFAKRGNLQTPKMLPFDGGAELATQLVAGAVQAGVLNLAEASSQIEAGEICPTIVLADERMAKIPDVPTANELGIPVSFSTVRGFVVHADTPPEVAEKIEKALMNAMNHSVFQAFLESAGLDPTSVAGSDVWGVQIEATVNDMSDALKELGFIE